MESDPTALSAATTVRTVRSRVRHDGREYAEVAVPLLTGGDVMLLTSSLSDQLATVALVKRRLLFATVAALLISFVLGFAVGFDGFVGPTIVGCLIVGSLVLAPAIVFGYAVKAADRDDREHGR